MSKPTLTPMGDKQVKSLGKAVIGILAIGLAGGLALIEIAKKIGDNLIEDKDDE